MLRKVCNIANIPDSDDDTETATLMKLESKIKAKIYGQDDAIHQVVEAILMSKAGLSDMQKPIASFLFVGQTGVGKTEIVKVLAQELGTDLVRFDMSEYTEKHTVAKLIGSPAGYVGYDDGGLLTTAIRQKPNCVLLLDEIEKAHPDIYNILLQIMDYASLTDNKGQKADFRHVILVMTSNAGAQYAHQATVGFNGASAGSAMMTAVKKTFKPEFINRLSATVLFNDINKEMAALILDKKINELRSRIKARKITLELTQQATDELLRRGFSPQYGAREIDRVINSTINPLLTKEILFGSLKNGGHTTLDFVNGEMILSKTTA
jgi:ATP-dependent Clp protease ATP-binding subunit ClpA